jgi:hypothetical protein
MGLGRNADGYAGKGRIALISAIVKSDKILSEVLLYYESQDIHNPA